MVGSSSPSSLSASSSSSDCTQSSQIKIKRTRYSFLKKLHLREIRGSFQTRQNGSRLVLFHDLPPRLQFSLEDLAPTSCLYDGHVFLGFTKDGHFIISYTSQMEVDLPFTNPTYVYKLYYWRFVPNEPLKKVSEIHLFKDFEILSELLISVCQWPSDDTKILIHGFSPLGDQEHRSPQNQCYLTIAAVPPVYPCEECKASYINFCPDDEEWDTHQSTCLFHGFVLHVQYHLVPPFPHFIPKVSLKKDGSVVLNTGDSLIALSISTEVKNDLMTGKHSSKLLPDCYDVTYPRNEDHLFSSGNASTSTSSEVTEAEVSSVYSPNSDLGLGNLYDGSSNTCAQFNDTLKYVTTCKTGSPHGEEQATSQSSSISNESLRFSSDLESTSASSSSVFELFASPGRRSKHKFYSKLELKDEGKSEVFCDSKPHDLNSDVTSNEKEMPEMADECSSPCSENCASPVRPYKHPSLNLRGVSDGSCALRTYSRLPSDEKNLKFGYNESLKENVSPELELRGYQGRSVDGIAKITSDYAYLNPAFPRATSPENGNSSLQTTNCITCASRVFVPHVDANLSNETEEEELGNSAYQNSLSFEVYWPSATRLLPCPTSLLQAVTGPVLAVKQTAFDVEPYLHEIAQRLCSEAGQKYQAFTDYDIQIVDVFAETGDVLVLVVMLVQATPKNKGHAKYLRSMCGIVRKQYETGFTFLWNIQTGKYKVVDTESLKEIDMLKGKYMIPRPWNPGRKRCALLQEKWLLPCTPKQDVQVLTNKPVLTGIPLEMFCPLSGDVAIVRSKN